MAINESLEVLRQKVVSISQSLNSLGLNQGTSGNLSIRIPGGMLITPSSVAYDQLKSQDIFSLTLSGRPLTLASDETLNNKFRPSSEWRLHADILLERKDINAVLHCHSKYSTALACQRIRLPSFHYMVAVAGGNDIRCSKYATFGTKELSAYALEALEDRFACLLANHGLVTIGFSIEHALSIAIEIETLSSIYISSRNIAEPYHLSQQEMSCVLEKFKDISYGKKTYLE